MTAVTAFGAAREVTGSRHVLEAGAARVLVDCGVFQGRREESRRKTAEFQFDPAAVDASVNTHGHLDHCGAYPLLVRRGFRGAVWATSATRDVARLVLEDSARVQAADARHVNKRQAADPRAGRVAMPPLYDADDVAEAVGRFRCVEYHRPFDVAPGVVATLFDAGHILGSAIVRFDLRRGDGGSEPIRVAFTGDLGRRDMPIIRDPESPGPIDWLVCESTYGERLHDDASLAEDELAEVIRETVAREGRVVVPAFAVGRVQELVWHLHRLYDSHKIPRVPVFVDSPMAARATEVFREHVECYDRQTVSEFLENGDNPFSYKALRFVTDREESKRLNGYRHPCIVISSSGMCEAGRVLHHLVRTVDDPRCTILVVGFMAGNTLGRALADRRPEVRIFGETFRLRARVKILNSFSAHADRREIGDWIGGLDRTRLKGVFLVHGEPDAQDALASHLLGMGIPRVEALLPGRPVALD